jgi:hypothetical protein
VILVVFLLMGIGLWLEDNYELLFSGAKGMQAAGQNGGAMAGTAIGSAPVQERHRGFVAFRSAKGRSFAERKTTLFVDESLRRPRSDASCNSLIQNRQST